MALDRNKILEQVAEKIDLIIASHEERMKSPSAKFIPDEAMRNINLMTTLATRIRVMLSPFGSFGALSDGITKLDNLEIKTNLNTVTTFKNLIAQRGTIPLFYDSYYSNAALIDVSNGETTQINTAKSSRQYRFYDENSEDYKNRAYADNLLWISLNNDSDLMTGLNQLITDLSVEKDQRETNVVIKSQQEKEELIKQQKQEETQIKTEVINKLNFDDDDIFIKQYQNIEPLLKNLSREIADEIKLINAQVARPAHSKIQPKEAHEQNELLFAQLQIYMLNRYKKLASNKSKIDKNTNILAVLLSQYGLVTLNKPHKINVEKVEELKEKYPTHYYGTTLLFELENSNSKLDFAIKSQITNAIKKVMNSDKTESDKMQELDQVVLDSYYHVRKNQGHFSSSFGNVLEKFLKDPEKLNTVGKYNIDIPHQIAKDAPVPKLQTLKKKIHRLATVKLDDLWGNNKIKNSAFFEKLKYEYDEIVFIIKDDKTTIPESLLNILKKNGLQVSPHIISEKNGISFDSLKKISDSVQSKKPDQSIDITITSARILELTQLSKTKINKELANINVDYLHINGKTNSSLQNYTDDMLNYNNDQRSKKDIRLGKSESDNLIHALEKFIATQTVQYNSRPASLINSIFSKSNQVRDKKAIFAAEKLIANLKQDPKKDISKKFTSEDEKQLSSGDLGRLVKNYPSAFATYINKPLQQHSKKNN